MLHAWGLVAGVTLGLPVRPPFFFLLNVGDCVAAIRALGVTRFGGARLFSRLARGWPCGWLGLLRGENDGR